MRKRTVLPGVEDFGLTGSGTNAAWARSEWLPLGVVGAGAPYPTRAKLAYSQTGLYVLVDCVDRRLTCTRLRDMDDLFREDVVEFFVWPDTKHALYFEYEISPLNAELPILVPNRRGRFCGWQPWHYEGARRTRHRTAVRGGRKQPGADVEGWTAEFFIPFQLMVGYADIPPRPGDRWRANVYRIDYDSGSPVHYAWSPVDGPSFHNYRQFGTIEFGAPNPRVSASLQPSRSRRTRD